MTGTDEQRAAIKALYVRYWREIAIALLLVVLAACVARWRSSQNEADSLRARVDFSLTIAEEERKLDALREREAQLYPEIEKKQKELSALDAELAKRSEAIQRVTKASIRQRVEKLTPNGITEAFKARGYPVRTFQEGAR